MRQKDKHSPPELKKVHPLGKSPAITIEAPSLGEPLVLAESGAIVEYIADHFGTHLIPKRYADGKDGLVGGETKEWLRYRVSNDFIYVGLFATTTSAQCRSSIWNTLCCQSYWKIDMSSFTRCKRSVDSTSNALVWRRWRVSCRTFLLCIRALPMV